MNHIKYSENNICAFNLTLKSPTIIKLSVDIFSIMDSNSAKKLTMKNLKCTLNDDDV